MPIYTNHPCDDGFLPKKHPLISSIGIGPKVTKLIDAATKDWLNKHPEATTTVEDDSLEEKKLKSSFSLELCRCFDVVTNMQAATDLKAGMICHTNGFHSAGDGGAAFYKVTEDGEPNGMDVLALQGGLYATLIVTKSYVTPEMFGAYGDGTHDDSVSLQKAFDNGANILANNTYLVKDITITNAVHLRGGSYINNSSTDYIISITADDVLIDGVTIDGQNLSNGVSISYCRRVTLKNSEIKNIKAASYTNAVYINRSNEVTIDTCHIHGVSNDNSVATRGLLSNRSNGTVVCNTLIHNVVSGDDGDGVQFIFDGVPSEETDNGCVISGCTLYDCSKRYIKIQQKNCVVEKCKILGSISTILATSASIALYDCDLTVRNSFINGNSPTQIALVGTAVSDFETCENILIANNTIKASSNSGYNPIIGTSSNSDIEFDNIIITGNTLVGYGGTQVAIQVRNLAGKNIIISNNSCSDVSSLFTVRCDSEQQAYELYNVIVAENTAHVENAVIFALYSYVTIKRLVVTGNSFEITGTNPEYNVIRFLAGTFDGNDAVIDNNNGYASSISSKALDGWNRVGWFSVRPITNVPDGFTYFCRDISMPLTYYSGSWYKPDGTVYTA